MHMPAEKIDRWYEIFADAQGGVAEAQAALGIALHTGSDGFDRNVGKAIEWLALAAKQGHVESQFALAEMYATAEEVLDMSKAMYWYERASEGGHAPAREKLAQLKGEEVEKKLQRLTFQAEQGDVASQHTLGRFYRKGGRLRNVQLARFWLTKAAEQHHADAQFELGELYALEEEIHDLLRARSWYAKAAALGHAKGAERVEVIDLCLKEQALKSAVTSRRSRKHRHAFSRLLVSLWNALDAANFVAAYSLMAKLKTGQPG